MKATSVELARTIWLFHLQEINSSGRSFTRPFSQLLEKYNFKRHPRNVLDIDEQHGLVFEQGDFKTASGAEISFDLKLYDDGMIVDSRSSTSDSNQVLDEITSWLHSEHGFDSPKQTSLKIRFLSQLAVQTDRKLTVLESVLGRFADLFATELSKVEGQPIQASLGGINIWPHDNDKLMRIAPFRFEHKNGAPLSQNRYFAQAPLETDVHVKLLDEFEKLMA